MALLKMKNPFKLVRYALAGWIPGGRRHCVLCGHQVWRFMPYRRGVAAPLMVALEVVGSDPVNFECPHCGAHDRERHLLLYLRASGLLAALPTLEVLHFAPEKRLGRVLRAAAQARYLMCDLYPQSPEVMRVDMTDMPFEDCSFDLLLANHVLEHVQDDLRALTEIRRVLKPGGHAILQTPYSRKLAATWSDPGIADDAARLEAYGQEDHVRLYGAEIFRRFASVGLTDCVQPHSELLPGIDARAYGVNPSEPFFLFRRDA